MSKKLYVAHVSFDMFVLANNEREAERIAADHASEDLDSHLSPPITASLAVAEHYRNEDSMPWCAEGENDDEKTVAELLSEQLTREQEAEAQRLADLNQLKLPFGGANG